MNKYGYNNYEEEVNPEIGKKKIKTKGKGRALWSAIILILVVLFFSSAYYVKEGKYAIISRFNEVVAIKESPGFAFRIPIFESKTDLTKKLEFYDVSPSDVLTKDKKSMIGDTYVAWKIVDPLKYLRTAGSLSEIERRLETAVYGGLKTTIGSLNQVDIIESRTTNGINIAILENSKSSLEAYGVEIVDIQVKLFDLPESNKQAVFDRMISERQNIVATYLAEGEEEAKKIRNTANSEKRVILSKADADAEKLIAEGEREYMRILASAYNGADRAEFYEFLRGLDAIKKSLTGDKIIILPRDSKITDNLIGK